jgi:hypothetical protein
VSAVDRLTILTTAARDRGKLATKRITRTDGEWRIENYSQATWWSVRQIEVSGIISLGRTLGSLQGDACSCIVRGEPIDGINLSCCRRLKDAAEDGTPPSFEPTARWWLAVDADSILTPIWDPDRLARRRATLERNRGEHGTPLRKDEDDGEDVDLAGDEDPAPIDPVRDWAIAVRAVVVTLPPEFHDASVWWQMTSGAGIKPGIRIRLWFWLDRPVSDDEAKRWLADAPIDHSLYCANTPHYIARPIFDPPELDPALLRSGFWWRHSNAVAVRDLRPKPKLEPQTTNATYKARFDLSDRAQRYASACIDGIVAAPDGQGRKKAIAVARLLYGMAKHGLLDQAKVTTVLTDAMKNRGWGANERGRWSQAEIERHFAYALAHADTTLPEGFR